MDEIRDGRLRVAAARADYLRSGLQAGTEVRGVIAASWARSSAAGVDALRASARYHTDLDTSGRLVRSARTVIERLAEETSELALSIALTDSTARLLLRVDTDPMIGRLLDGVEFAPGFEYSEDAMGTNGVGTAFESGQAVVVAGPEHFSERLQAFSCTGAPVRDPVTGRVEGILDMTCLVQHASPVIRSLVRSATREIERRLLLDRDDGQHAVYERYVRAAARPGVAVGGVSATMLLSNRRLQEDFDADEQQAIREHAGFLAERGRTGDDVVTLASGRRVTVRGHRVEVGGRTAGVVFEAREVAAGAAAPTRPAATTIELGGLRTAGVGVGTGAGHDAASVTAPPSATGSAPAWRRAVEDTAAALRRRLPLIVIGEPATGKASLVVDCFRAEHPDGSLIEVDAAGFAADAAVRREVRATVRGATGEVLVVLRRIDRVPADGAAIVERLVTASDEAGRTFGVAATMVRADASAPTPASSTAAAKTTPGPVGGFRESVVVPPVRHRRQDLPLIVSRLLDEVAPGRTAGGEVLRAIARYEWPGNLAELREMLAEAAERRPVGPLVADDLPGRMFGNPGRALGALESAERDAIVAALRELGGNRVQAAGRLGISRATLYRKLQQYAISI
ncbi:sigma-54-dependent Fis family transcriptional regulator [Agromyces bauzanensis]